MWSAHFLLCKIVKSRRKTNTKLKNNHPILENSITSTLKKCATQKLISSTKYCILRDVTDSTTSWRTKYIAYYTEMLHGSDLLFDLYFAVFVKMLTVLIYGINSMPLFTAIAVRTPLGYAVGTLYAWMFLFLKFQMLFTCGLSSVIIFVIFLFCQQRFVLSRFSCCPKSPDNK